MAELLAVVGPKIGLSAAATSTISTIATVAQVAVPVMGAIAGNQAANEQAAYYEQAGKNERVAANIKAERERREARLRQSRDRTAMAEGGALSGTSFDVLNQNAVSRELDALTVEYMGEIDGQGMDNRAAQARRSASPLNIFTAAIDGFSDIDPLNLGGQP